MLRGVEEDGLLGKYEFCILMSGLKISCMLSFIILYLH